MSWDFAITARPKTFSGGAIGGFSTVGYSLGAVMKQDDPKEDRVKYSKCSICDTEFDYVHIAGPLRTLCSDACRRIMQANSAREFKRRKRAHDNAKLPVPAEHTDMGEREL